MTDLQSREFDWTDWYAWTFAEILSVERTQEFAGELGLAEISEKYSDMMLPARGYLEVLYATLIAEVQNDPLYVRVVRRWSEYRVKSPVLSDDVLRDLAPRRRSASEAFRAVFVRLLGRRGSGIAEDLGHWFESSYKPGDPGWLWPWALRYFFVDNPGEIGPGESELNIEEIALIGNWSKRYEERKRRLEVRFENLVEEASKTAVPSPWERVLQAYGSDPETEVNPDYDRDLISFPWLRNIGRCLQHRFVVEEWGALKEEVGYETLEDIVKLVRQRADRLPLNIALPGPPHQL